MGALAIGLRGTPAAMADEWFGAANGPLGTSLSEQQLAAGEAFVRRYPTVDIHSHAGRFFLRGMVDPSPRIQSYGEPFDDKVIAAMREGRVSGALFSGVADTRLLEFSEKRGLFANREFATGEAWQDYRRQVDVMKAMIGSKILTRGRSPGDILRAHRRGRTAAVFAIEGGDFIEEKLDRVWHAHRDGVRAITIVHYHVNQIGDIQTEAAVHNGLTPLGAAIVREMNQAGIIIDLAHAPFSVVKSVLDISTKPMMISHTNISGPQSQHPRLVSAEHARLVAAHGGIIGSIPWGIGQSTFADWIKSILHMVDVVGVDHVAIGTDMDATYMPVFTDYRLWRLIPSALLAAGLSERDTAKIMGGNFLRLFGAIA
jgi:membrane dipeptidase